MNNWSFLGLNSGFWLFGLPLFALWVASELYAKDKEENSLNELEDFIEAEDIEELELYTMEFKINKEERWKIGQVMKRGNFDSIDELIRNSIYEMIKQ